MSPVGAWHAHTYASIDGRALEARVYQPPRPRTLEADAPATPPEPRPTIVHVVGGGWTEGGPSTDERFHQFLSSRGVVCVVPEVRVAPEVQHPAALLDCDRLLRWIAEHATALGVDLERLIVVGTGSGAHAVLGALHSSDALRRTIQPTAAVAVWPMVDPLTSMRRSEETVERDALHAAAMAYFGSMERMRRAAVPERLHDGAPRQLPVLVVTRSDGVVGAPAEVSNELAHAWSNLGAPVQLIDCEPDDGTDLRTMLLELTVEGPRLDAEITPG